MSRYLLATNHLLGWTGSEITVATVGTALREAGHQVLVYAPFWGRADADTALLGGLPATQRLADLVAFQPDAAYTQHHPVATAVRATLPACPMAHAVLGVLPYLEQPPRRDLGLARLLPISEETQAALLASGHPPTDMALLRNLVDDRLFSAADDAPPAGLQTITCYSYKLDPPDLRALQAAATARGLALRLDTNTGAGSTPYADAPRRICTGELVVASGRGAIEAMLCGRTPLIMANCGDDGLVTPDNFSALIRTNFSGRTHGRKFSANELGQAIDAYRPEHGSALRRLALDHFGLSRRRSALLELFDWLAASGPHALPDQALQSIRFESEGLELQRQFSARAAAMRQDVAAAQAGLGWRDRMRLGHAAWRANDQAVAMDHYIAARSVGGRKKSAAPGGSESHFAPAFRCLPPGRRLKSGDKLGSRSTRLATIPSAAHAPSRCTDDPVALRSAATLALTQLATRVTRASSPGPQLAALEALLRLDPENVWALAQLARVTPTV